MAIPIAGHYSTARSRKPIRWLWIRQPDRSYPLLLRYGSYIGLTETRIKIAQYLFQRQGMLVVLVARFVAVLRSVVGFIAGANRMPFAKFMIANSAGAVTWALFYGFGAYYFGKGVE
jgi:membrane protein DedA with SNARE-associated domain